MWLKFIVLVVATCVYAQECPGGVGLNCGTFPYTPLTRLNDADDLVPFGPWPPSKQGVFTFAVEDPTAPTYFEPINEYGEEWPFPTISEKGFSQTGYKIIFPADPEDMEDAVDSKPWGLPKEAFLNQGRPAPPKANVGIKQGRHKLAIHIGGAVQYDIDTDIIGQKIVSRGKWIYLTNIGTPGELSGVEGHLTMQNRVNTLTSALLYLERLNNDPRNKRFFNRIDFSDPYFVSESVGGLIPICMENGCHGNFNITKQPYPRFGFVRNWDPSSQAYLNYTDWIGYNQPQVTVLSQFAGGQWGMDFRQWAQTVVDHNQANSNVYTFGSPHEGVAALTGCANSNMAVLYDFYKNVTYWYGEPGGASKGAAGIAANFWKYPNQTVYRYCAPSNLDAFINPKYPQIPSRVLVDLLHSIDLNATSALESEDANAALHRNFRKDKWVAIQHAHFNGTRHFLYADNSEISTGNCTWDENGFVQKEAMTLENWNYLSYPSSSLAFELRFQDDGPLHNYVNCYRCPTNTTCVPCKFTCYTYVGSDGKLYMVPAQSP